MGSGNESEILMLMLDKSTYRNIPINSHPVVKKILTHVEKFTKCSVEFKFLATVLRYCLAMAAGALIYCHVPGRWDLQQKPPRSMPTCWTTENLILLELLELPEFPEFWIMVWEGGTQQ